MSSVAAATYFDWRKEARSFDRITAYAWDEVNLTGDHEPQKLQVFHVAANLLRHLGVQPILAVPFCLTRKKPATTGNHSRPRALGTALRVGSADCRKELKIDGKSYSIVGVMGEGYDFPMPAEAPLPLFSLPRKKLERNASAGSLSWDVCNRGPLEEGAAEMRAIAQRQAEQFPTPTGAINCNPARSRIVTGTLLPRRIHDSASGRVGFVPHRLRRCCQRALRPRHGPCAANPPFELRWASRWRIMRQLLIESVLLSLGGAALGLVIAQWDLSMILSHMPPDVAKFVAGWKTIRLDAGAFLFTLAISLAAGVLSGIAPSLLSSRTNLTGALKDGGRGSSAGQARHRSSRRAGRSGSCPRAGFAGRRRLAGQEFPGPSSTSTRAITPKPRSP